MLAVKRQAVVVRLFARRDAFAEADHIRRDAHVTALHQLDGEGQLRITFDATRFFFALGDSLMQADHRRNARRAELLRHQQVGGNPIIHLASDHDVPASVVFQIFDSQLADFECRRLRVDRCAQDLLDRRGDFLATILPITD